MKILLCFILITSISLARMSSEGSNQLIKKFEGCALKAYPDCNGVYRIGYGQTAGKLKSITKQQADKMLDKRLIKSENQVLKAIDSNISLTKYQFDALVSLTYNIGKLPKGIQILVNSNQLDKVPDEIRTYCKGHMKDGTHKKMRGLVKRRNAEALWFQTPEFVIL